MNTPTGFVTADEARKLSESFVPNSVTIEDTLKIVEGKIRTAATKGERSVKINVAHMAPAVKQHLKGSGFEVSMFRAVDEYDRANKPTGEIEVRW